MVLVTVTMWRFRPVDPPNPMEDTLLFQMGIHWGETLQAGGLLLFWRCPPDFMANWLCAVCRSCVSTGANTGRKRKTNEGRTQGPIKAGKKAVGRTLRKTQRPWLTRRMRWKRTVFPKSISDAFVLV